MLNKIINLLRGRLYVCEPLEYQDRQGARVKVRAWSRSSARMKAYDVLKCENIVVREYE